MEQTDTQTEWRQHLAAWLDNDDWNPEQLLRWLQGHDFPFDASQDEPYIFLLRGLPVGGDRYRAEKTLAERVAVIVNDAPEVNRPGRQPEKLLYNLLMLAAGLACAEELADPLYQMFMRRAIGERWRGVDLRGRLRDALIHNQIDDRLKPVWFSMLAQGEKSDDFLKGNIYDALEGIRLMISSNDGEPSLEAIGCALKESALYLEPEQERRPKFRQYIRRMMDTFPGRPTWDVDLIHQADVNQWPEWAVECLPSLCVPLESSPEGVVTFYLWEPLAQVIPERQIILSGTLCGQTVSVAKLTKEGVDLIQAIAPEFEANRYRNPWPSRRAGEAVKIESMTYLEAKMGGKGSRKASAFRQARKQMLVENALSLGVAAGRQEK